MIIRAVAPAFLLALFAPLVSAPAAGAAGTGAIHPGVMLFTGGNQCTANFIYTGGGSTYIGQAAHCATTGNNTQINGCTTGSQPIGTPVQITGASQPGVLAYSSWITMQSLHESDATLCMFNDLSLVRIDPSDVPNIDPSVPHWGGPTGLNTTGLTFGDNVYGYGNSELRLGITTLSPKLGISEGDNGSGWSHDTFMAVTPGIPGDSGGALLDSSGRATGILSTIGVGVPGPIINSYGDVGRELSFASANGFAVSLVPGTTAFNPSQLPLG